MPNDDVVILPAAIKDLLDAEAKKHGYSAEQIVVTMKDPVNISQAKVEFGS